MLSAGHTPLLAVVRPNLLAKPVTLVIPKVTIKKEVQYGRCSDRHRLRSQRQWQTRLKKEYLNNDIEKIVLLASVYLDPVADYNKIYRYNYGAMKLAISRAMDAFPGQKDPYL